MCGVAGYQGGFGAELLGAMTASLAHRGPDGAGIHVWHGTQSDAGFGHRRLAIIDRGPSGAQPMSVQCAACHAFGLDDLALTYNGELYEYRALAQVLRQRGHRFAGQSDSEVLLHLYGDRGLEILPGLNGMFAFAIRDGRNEGRPDGVERGDVLLVRDQLGIKPLYYAQVRSGFLFASELKALRLCPEVSTDVDPVAIHHHLAYLWAPAPRTMLRDVRKLRPGEGLIVRKGRIHRQWRYWDLPYGRPTMAGTFDDIAVELRDVLGAAVARQMVADVPVGAFLSGGLDSSTVVSLMRGVDHPPPQCFGVGFGPGYLGGENADDLPYARHVAARLGVPLTEVIADPAVIGRLDEMLYHLDEPQADPAALNVLVVAERARARGVTVLMSGAGGDDLFSGYRRHRALGVAAHWRWAPRSARQLIARAARAVGEGRNPGWLGRPALRRAARLFGTMDLAGDRLLASYFCWSGEGMRRTLYSPAMADAIGPADVAEPLLESLQRIPLERDPLNRLLYLEASHFLADHNLGYTDKMAMAAGVEVRVPLIDLAVVDFATRIPPSFKQRGRTGKAILKRAMEGELPSAVIRRGKAGFGAPLRQWMQRELRPLVDETLSAATLARRGWFNPAAVAALVKADRAGQVDGAYTVFALVCLERWAQRFVDGGG